MACNLAAQNGPAKWLLKMTAKAYTLQMMKHAIVTAK